MFGFLKKNHTSVKNIKLPPMEADGEKEVIGAPMNGVVVPCSEIKDLTFQKEMLGKCVAIKPTEGWVYAPFDGKVEMMIETLHAVSVTSENGAEIMIHIGIDTVALKGKYFKSYVKEGSVVKRGDLLLEFQLEGIKAEGYELISPVILCNSEEYEDVEKTTKECIHVGETLMKLKK